MEHGQEVFWICFLGEVLDWKRKWGLTSWVGMGGGEKEG